MIGYEKKVLFPPTGMPLAIRNSRIKLSQGHVFWREVGHGIPIVFLNGSWGDGSVWLPILEHLGTAYHCLALDLIGFGESDCPKLPYSITLQTEALLEFVGALRLKTFFLVAPEVSGWVAASFAQQHPERVLGLVLLNAEGVTIRGAKNRWFWPRLLTTPLLAWLWRSLSPIGTMLGKADNVAVLLQWQQRLRRSPVACKLLFRRRQAAINAELLNAQIPWLKMPLLVLWSEKDTPINAALNQSYAAAPQAILRVMPAPYPELLSEAPNKVASEISGFISANR